METSKLAKLAFRQTAVFTFLSSSYDATMCSGAELGRKRDICTNSKFLSQPWCGSAPQIAQSANTQQCQPLARLCGVSKMGESDSCKLESWPGDLGDRCAGKYVAPAPAGKFLLGSNPSFCFSPLGIMFLALYCTVLFGMKTALLCADF